MTGHVLWSPPDLFGHRRAEACSDGEIEVRTIRKSVATALITNHHYSKSAVWSSNLHLGVFVNGDLRGAMQFGPGMNPMSGSRVVRETYPGQWLEPNRMWISDDHPPYAASRAIAYAIRLIRYWRPHIKWVQSFADSRCGKAGGIYQAASFLYLGCHDTTFYEIDGQWFHQSMRGRKAVDSRGWGSGPKIAYFRANEDRAVPHIFTQYRYIRLLDQRLRKDLVLSVLPYPKGSVLQQAERAQQEAAS